MHPILRQVPPSFPRPSIQVTFMPICAALIAETYPPGPPPRTTTSWIGRHIVETFLQLPQIFQNQRSPAALLTQTRGPRTGPGRSGCQQLDCAQTDTRLSALATPCLSTVVRVATPRATLYKSSFARHSLDAHSVKMTVISIGRLRSARMVADFIMPTYRFDLHLPRATKIPSALYTILASPPRVDSPVIAGPEQLVISVCKNPQGRRRFGTLCHW